MEKVYLVSRGHYSDYRVDAVFDSQEKAQAYIDSFGLYQVFNDIEEIDFNPALPKKRGRDGLFGFRINVSESLDVRSVYTSQVYEQEADVNLIEYIYGRRQKDILSCRVWARNKDHAIKIAVEKARQIKATVGWGNLIDN